MRLWKMIKNLQNARIVIISFLFQSHFCSFIYNRLNLSSK